MRVAVISDIHGNAVALDAVLADLEREPHDALVCLGDVFEGGPQPREVLARLRAIECPVVMGNTDEWLADLRGDGVPEWRVEIARWVVDQLGDEGVGFIRTFRPTVEVDLGDATLLCFHGTPSSNDGLLMPTTPDDEFAAKLGDADAAVLAGGHIHLQWLRRIRGSAYVSPGSIGMANDYQRAAREAGFDEYAEYALVRLDGHRLAVDFRRVRYDVDELIRVLRTSGMPHAEERGVRKWRRA